MVQLLDIINTDNTFKLVNYRGREVWIGKCIQCNRKLYISRDGTAISESTIEHIVPKYHCGTDEMANLGIACKNCNNLKGRTIDNKKRGDPKLEKVIAKLQEKRQKSLINT